METLPEEAQQRQEKVDNVSTCNTVSDTCTIKMLDKLRITLINTLEHFSSGKIAIQVKEWRNITSDYYILTCVKGYKIEFEDIPYQSDHPSLIHFNPQERLVNNKEIEKLRSVNVIERVVNKSVENEFLSNIFL